jgi:hypothetical protein
MAAFGVFVFPADLTIKIAFGPQSIVSEYTPRRRIFAGDG